MSAQENPNYMARELARKVRDARFAKGYREAMVGFGGHGEATAGERSTAWRQAAPSPGISDAPPILSWPGR